SFGGSTEPCAIANLYSIGCLGDAENKKHSAALFKHVQKTLGIKGDSVRLGYCAMEAQSWARGGASASAAAAALARQLCSRLGGSEARVLAYGSPCCRFESRP
ncbi:hypothetical protein HPB47_027729, partial [Ixodes persulcatus]